MNKNYKVTFEARSRNAHGAFCRQIVFVQAENKDEANRAAMHKLHEANFETRFPLSTEESEEFRKFEQFSNNGVIDMEKLAAQNKKTLEDYMAKKKAEGKINFRND